jgi:hypothetical protein
LADVANWYRKAVEGANTTKPVERLWRAFASLATTPASLWCLLATRQPRKKSEAPKPLARDPNAECPDCKCKYAYTNFYDECYACGRGLFE